MKHSREALLLALVMLLMAACAGGTSTPQPTVPLATPAQTVEPEGQAPEASPQPSATDVTQVSATSLAALGAPPPAANAAAPVTRIRFKTGATDAVVSGHLAAGGSARYVLAAGAEQIMRVSLSPEQGQVILVIWGADGTVLISDHAASTYWAGSLPTAQDYYIDIRAALGVAVDYTLEVVIPERIRFASGATSASVKGTLAAAGGHSYVLGAAGGQTMTVNLTYPSGQALLIIWGADGTVLISDHAEAQQWGGTLPSTQDYYIDVRAAVDSSAVAYTLKVSIPPAGQGDEPQATRIKFAAGGTSATVQGSVPPGRVKRYVLGAMAGQTMAVRLSPANAQAYVVIWGADGSVLMSGAGEGKEWSGVLTITEDYYIDVKASGGATVQYSLRVEIPPK